MIDRTESETGENGHASLDAAADQIRKAEGQIHSTATREELAETRTELAEARTELAEMRTAIAEVRAEQAEEKLKTLEEKCGEHFEQQPEATATEGTRPLARLTERQREILRYIAEGQNTKEIAHLLNLSPKTVEYHRIKLMEAVHVYDVPGLVRLAVRAGLVPADK